MTDRQSPRAQRQLAMATLLLLPCIAGGCAAIGAAAYKVAGPEVQPAMYKPEKEPMLILVENYANPSVGAIECERLAARLQDQFDRNKVAPLVDPDKLANVRDAHLAEYEKMTVPEIGRAAGAKQVLYINVRQIGLDQDGTLARATADVRVRIIDAADGTTRWPRDESAGRPASSKTAWTELNTSTFNQTTLGENLESQMYDDLSDQIARLFYDYKPED